MNKMENINGRYRCKVCNKNYASYKSLWNHNKQFHTDSVTSNLKCDTNSSLNDTRSNLLLPQITETKILSYECKFCNKKFNFRQNKYQHEKTCKLKINEDNRINSLEEQNKFLQNEINNLKQEFASLVKEKGKLHHKTLQKFNNKLNNINNNTNSFNTINNTFVKFSNLDYQQIFSPKEIKSILTKKLMKSLEEFIKQVHFNKKHPEYGNIYITNMKDNLAYIFNGSEFIVTDKNETLNDLVDNHTTEINLSLEKHRATLSSYTINKIEEMINKLESNNKFIDHQNNKTFSCYKVYKINNIKKDIYNLSDRKNLDLLCNSKLFEKLEQSDNSDEELSI